MGDRLAGKVALITGTANGQGRAAALLFAREGAAVVGCDLKEEEARETVAMVEAEGGRMTSMEPVDLGDSAAARAWVDAAAAVYGGVDILYNNASLPKFAPISSMTDEDWHYTIRNELHLMFYATSQAWPHLVARGGGSIINTASISGMRSMPETPGSIAHATTKAAVIGMTRELAMEGGPHNIRANTISPGAIETPATAPALASSDFRARHINRIFLDRIGTVDDVAALALFLASDEARWITGSNYVVDGGFTAR